MRTLFLFGLLVLLAGTVIAVGGQGDGHGQDGVGYGQGNSNGTTGQDRNQTEEQLGDQNRTHNQTGEGNQTMEQEKEKNQTKGGNETGISEQVHQIIEGRKNGSITVPQGFLVRIIAQNHTLTVENASVILNETIDASVWINGKNKTLKLSPHDGTVNITDENVTVETNETIDIENDTLSVGGEKVLIMPSEVPQKVRARTINSAVLHVVNGDPEYQVNATRGAKVLWIFDANMDVETTVDASTGDVKSEKRPWWSFLATSED